MENSSCLLYILCSLTFDLLEARGLTCGQIEEEGYRGREREKRDEKY